MSGAPFLYAPMTRPVDPAATESSGTPDLDVERCGICQQQHDQVGKENAVLVVLCPQRTPVKELCVRAGDHDDVVPLIAGHDIEAVAPDEKEVADYWRRESEHRHDRDQRTWYPVQKSIPLLSWFDRRGQLGGVQQLVRRKGHASTTPVRCHRRETGRNDKATAEPSIPTAARISPRTKLVGRYRTVTI